jgi:endonuclease G
VAYRLTREEAQSDAFSRKGMKFARDAEVPSGSAAPADYKRSGYDRGHLAPAADMQWSAEALRESFLMSNISPQNPQFDRGLWARIEETVRDFAVAHETVEVVTGPVLREGLPAIGESRVAVPEYYYKVLLAHGEGDVHAIGFVTANSASNLPPLRYVVTVDSVEALTGLDFYGALPDSIESQVEAEADTVWWFGSRHSSLKR